MEQAVEQAQVSALVDLGLGSSLGAFLHAVSDKASLRNLRRRHWRSLSMCLSFGFSFGFLHLCQVQRSGL